MKQRHSVPQRTIYNINEYIQAQIICYIGDLNICTILKGFLNVVKYLHSIGKNCTTAAMDGASTNGHLHVVKYLHSIGKNCTTSAMDFAAAFNQKDVLRFLNSVNQKSTKNGLKWALANGHFETACYLELIHVLSNQSVNKQRYTI